MCRGFVGSNSLTFPCSSVSASYNFCASQPQGSLTRQRATQSRRLPVVTCTKIEFQPTVSSYVVQFMAESKVKYTGPAVFRRKKFSFAEHQMPGLCTCREGLGLRRPSRARTSTGLCTFTFRLACSLRHSRPSVPRCVLRLVSPSACMITLSLASQRLALPVFAGTLSLATHDIPGHMACRD